MEGLVQTLPQQTLLLAVAPTPLQTQTQTHHHLEQALIQTQEEDYLATHHLIPHQALDPVMFLDQVTLVLQEHWRLEVMLQLLEEEDYLDRIKLTTLLHLHHHLDKHNNNNRHQFLEVVVPRVPQHLGLQIRELLVVDSLEANQQLHRLLDLDHQQQITQQHPPLVRQQVQQMHLEQH